MFLQTANVPYDPQSSREAVAGSRQDDSAPLTLVMPMAGRGSRFSGTGEGLPKPLIDLCGKPFFWWATESVRRIAPLAQMVFVVLEEHVRRFGVDSEIRRHYPAATIVALPDITDGAAQTAALGLAALSGAGPVAICDSDHAFECGDSSLVVESLRRGTDAALLCFESTDPAYSYVELDPAGRVVGTVEKRPVSPLAIAGCYLFASPAVFLDAYRSYRLDCPYDEHFVSGVYNRLLDGGGRVVKHVLASHVSFGTPEELSRVLVSPDAFPPWASRT